MAREFVIDINVEGIDELRRKLRSEVAATPTRKFLQRSGDAIIGKAKPLTPVGVTGDLRKTIDKEVSTGTPVPTYVKVGSNMEYAPFVEFGRGPGKMPPFANINLWYRRKNQIGATEDVSSVVRAIQRAIAKRGVEAQPFLVPGFEQAVPAIQRHAVTWRDELEEAYKNER